MLIVLSGSTQTTPQLILDNDGTKLQRGQTDTFILDVDEDIGELQRITLTLDGTNSWKLLDVIVTNMETLEAYLFHADIKLDDGDAGDIPTVELTPADEGYVGTSGDSTTSLAAGFHSKYYTCLE